MESGLFDLQQRWPLHGVHPEYYRCCTLQCLRQPLFAAAPRINLLICSERIARSLLDQAIVRPCCSCMVVYLALPLEAANRLREATGSDLLNLAEEV